MSDTPHDRLAHWLDASSQGQHPADPAGLEPDVVEAVYALRPDLAPPPRVSIDDILAGLTEGPLAPTAAAHATEQREAAALAAFLDSDTPDDAELDSEPLEAIYALRPDLAPPPRVSMDDIFGSVTEGPFAAPDNIVSLPIAAHAQEPAAAPASEGGASNVVSLSERRRAWWALPGLGALAAAAAALLVVQPISLNEPAPMDLALDANRYEQAAPTAAPEPTSTAAPAGGDAYREQAPAAAATEGTTGRAPASGPGKAEEKPADVTGGAHEAKDNAADNTVLDGNLSASRSDDVATRERQSAVLEPSEDPVPELAPAPEAEPEPKPEPEPVEEASAGSLAGLLDELAENEAEELSEGEMADQLNSLGYIGDAVAENDEGDFEDAEVFADTPVVASVPSGGESYGGARLESEAVTGASRPGRVNRRNNGIFSAGSRGAEADAPSAPMAETIAEDMEDAPADDFDWSSRDASELRLEDVRERPESMTDLRTEAARSFQAAPDVTAGRPELAAAYAAADALVAQQELSAARAVLDPFRRSSDPDVVLDVAWRRCVLHLQQGFVVPAIAALDEGLQVVGGDTRLRARALYQKGQLLERRGDVAGATAAYAEAARLRR